MKHHLILSIKQGVLILALFCGASLNVIAQREHPFDKGDADVLVYEQLTSSNLPNNFHRHVDLKHVEAKPCNEAGIFVVEGEYYQVKSMKNDFYLQKRSGKYEILFDVRYPLESMTNLMLNYVENNIRTLEFNHHQYGNKIESGKIPMQVVYDIFGPHMETYCMVTKIDKDIIEATLIFRNVKLNFVHMFIFKSPLHDIFQNDGTLHAELYTNIPQSDIRSLFTKPKTQNNKR